MALLAATSWRVDRRRTIGAVATSLTDQITQLIAVYAVKLVIDAAAAGDRGRAIGWGVALGVAVTVSYAASAIGSTISNGLRERTAMAFEARLLALLAALPGLDHFETSRATGSRRARSPGAVGARIGRPGHHQHRQRRPPAGGHDVAAAGRVPDLDPPAAGRAGAGVGATKADKIYKRGEDESAEEARLAVRLQAQAVDPAAAAELRLHGFGPVLLERHRQASEAVIASRRRIAQKTGFLGFAVDAVFVAAQMGAIAFVVNRAIYGGMTAGDVVLTITLAFQLRYQVYWVIGSLEWMLRSLRTVGRVAWLAGEVG